MSQQDRNPDDAATNRNGKNDRETHGLCLLSLDGGGVRGLSTLYILRALMRRLNDERRKLGLDNVKPCDVFDLIGGTSTGGLIAIMLGRLEMDVGECIIAYKALMTAVFEKKQSLLAVGLRGMVKSRFSSKELEKAVKSVIEGRGEVTGHHIPVDEPFYLETKDEDSRKCRVFVCAQAKETGGVTLLRSYRPKGDEPGEATIWQAALATSAATTFFDPVRIGDRLYVDGAMGANNPANQIQKEADKIWCETTGRLEPLVKCFISLGTGNGGINPISDKAWKFLTESLTAVATDTRLTEQDVATRWKHYQDTRYFRFNVQQGLQKVGLAEYKEKGLMDAATAEYLDNQDTKPRVHSCVMNLRTKKYPPNREYCIEQEQLQAQEDRKAQQPPKTMTATEMSELTDLANTHLNKSRETITTSDLLKAQSIFTSILRAKLTQQPPATPKDLHRINSRLRATCLRLSHSPSFTPTQRMEYVRSASKYGKRALENAIASRNDNRVAQMQFYLACVGAREMELRGEEAQFPSSTLAERAAAREEIEVAWAMLRSIERVDMAVYDAMKREGMAQVG